MNVSDNSALNLDPSMKGFEDYLVYTYDEPNQQSSLEDFKSLKTCHLYHRSTTKSSDQNLKQYLASKGAHTPHDPSHQYTDDH